MPRRRLRDGLRVYPTLKRVLAFPLIRLLLIVLLFALLATPLVLVLHPPHSTWGVIAVTGGLVALLLISIAVVERVTVGVSLAAAGLGPRSGIRDLVLGALLGLALFSAVIAELAIGGHYAIGGVHLSPELGVTVLLVILAAAFEELLFRGVVFRLIEQWAGTWIALAVSAAIFGLVHGANPGATWVSTLAIALEAGVLLAAAYVVAGNLWFPIGLHFAWNFAEGPIFGTQVSGHDFGADIVAARVSGAPLITGGAFGPEAGVCAILTCLVVAAALLALAVRRSQIVPPRWQRVSAAPRVLSAESNR